MFVSRGDDAIALCYAGFVYSVKQYVIEQAALLGHPLAMGWMADDLKTEEECRWAKLAAEAGDRRGLCASGSILWDNNRFEDALVLFKRSADLGCASGMFCYGLYAYDNRDPRQYEWYARSARASDSWSVFMLRASQLLYDYSEGQCPFDVLFVLGRALVDQVQRVPTGDRHSATRLVGMYKTCLYSARQGVLCWLLCAKKLGLYRDVSQLIAHAVWNERHEFMETHQRRSVVEQGWCAIS